MSQNKRPSDMQRIANTFHFTKQDLVLNRQKKLSEAQLKRQWRRFWGGVILLIVIFGLGGLILGVFLWGTAPDGTFSFLPSNASVGENEQLYLFGRIFAGAFLLVLIVAVFGMIGTAISIRGREVHVYKGRIHLEQGFDDNYLKLMDENRRFDISDAQYNVLEPFVGGYDFTVYYIASRDGILSLEPI
ncbi:MAG: hypothetical protein AAF125_23830 [Chloroflexota bacterium]